MNNSEFVYKKTVWLSMIVHIFFKSTNKIVKQIETDFSFDIHRWN